MFGDRFQYRLADMAAFGPAGMMALAVGSPLAGGALSAMGTLAGGNWARASGLAQQNADNYQAQQLRQNAGLAMAAGQTKQFDTQQKTNLAIDTSTARAAASGVNAGVGSAATNVGEIAKRGSYLSALDLYNGKVQATGLLNEANAAEYSGKIAALEGSEKQSASYLAAGGTLAGSFGSAFKQYASPT